MITLDLPRNPPQEHLSITIGSGVVGTSEYKFNNGTDIRQVRVVKEETNELAYKVSLTYIGVSNSRPQWLLYINDRLPMMTTTGSLCYSGSKVFVIRPVTSEALLVQETDENQTGEVFIDLASDNYQASKTLNVRSNVQVSSDKIQALIEKGKIFKPSDDKVVKKIFHDQKVGVFLYTIDKSWNTDIYFANESEEFEKCETNMKAQCRCDIGDSWWNVKLPKRIEVHSLEFPQGNSTSHDGHGANVAFDKIPLKSITL